MSSLENNKRIVKNTFFLYIRMFITMLVGLYTSRIILMALGVADFGTYNVVGGVVILFSFFNNAMATTSQRFMSFELGAKNVTRFTQIFNASIRIHLFIALVVLVLAETVGLWFLNTHMNFPAHRMNAVNWIYQLSILATVIRISNVPYNAVVIAYERMSFFAFISILETGLKLLIAYLILLILSDKLILYAGLILGSSFFVVVFYMIYCHLNFKTVFFCRIHDKSIYKELLSFSGWALFGSVANVGFLEGVNVVINLFWGVTANASMGLATQVNSAMSQFVQNFQTALNPQLTKSQAGQDIDYQRNLIFRSAKFSFFLMLFVSLPVLFNTEYVLTLWLGKSPQFAAILCQCIIVGALVETLSGPLWVTIFATGRIKYYQIIISVVLLINLPLAYCVGKLGFPIQYILIIRIFLFIVAFFVRLLFLHKYIDFPFLQFLKVVILRILIVISAILPIQISLSMLIKNGSFISFLLSTLATLLVTSISIYFIGLSKNEQSFVRNIISNQLNRKIK